MAIQGVATNPAGSATAPTSGSSGSNSANSMGGMDTTFLNLLITELKSQDPTAPMDPTQMVGQMVNLNQLDQLIAIHQILQSNTSPTTLSSTPVPA